MKHWAVHLAPRLNPLLNGISIGKGACVPHGTEIKVQEGQKINLSAQAVDEDKYYLNQDYLKCVDYAPIDDTCRIHWSGTGAVHLEYSITDSNEDNEFTAPQLPPGEESQTFGIGVQPDDKWAAGDDGRPDNEAGNRNDPKGQITMITIRVINVCPTSVSLAAGQARYPSDWSKFWAKEAPDNFAFPIIGPPQDSFSSFGYLQARHEVAGPNPPPPNANWDGLVLVEEVWRDPLDGGDVDPTHFIPSFNPTQKCVGEGDGFVVGQPGEFSPIQDKPQSQIVNSFWDIASMGEPLSVMKVPFQGPETLECKQRFKCNGVVVPVDPNNRFRIEFSFSREVVSGQHKTQVTSTKSTD